MAERTTWLVWNVEYPDEGSIEVDASTLEEALAAGADAGWVENDPELADACIMTPELAAAREKNDESNRD